MDNWEVIQWAHWVSVVQNKDQVLRICALYPEDNKLPKEKASKIANMVKNLKENFSDKYYGKMPFRSIDDWDRDDYEFPADIPLLGFLYFGGISKSLGEAKKLIQQNSVSVNGEKVKRWDIPLSGSTIVKVGDMKYQLKGFF